MTEKSGVHSRSEDASEAGKAQRGPAPYTNGGPGGLESALVFHLAERCGEGSEKAEVQPSGATDVSKDASLEMQITVHANDGSTCASEGRRTVKDQSSPLWDTNIWGMESGGSKRKGGHP